MKFIDLFAGLGGFHKALHELNHECVFASEIDPVLKQLYEDNWDIEPAGDIRGIVSKNIDSIPAHDILCAGFPCQPFSKAGKQLGKEDKERGTLFNEIIKILKYRRPKYFILENVPFIAKHDNEETWNKMEKDLRRLGYDVDYHNFSPHEFGIPQHRIRIFIVGKLDSLGSFNFENIDNYKSDLLPIKNFIEEAPTVFKKIPKANIDCIKLWQEFINNIPKEVKMPGFPIWSMEFGATYPYEETIPFRMSSKELGYYKGNFGVSLKNLQKKEQRSLLPSYAYVSKKFPAWKQKYIRYNREFYKENKKFIEPVVKQISLYPSQSWQKLEWNVGNNKRIIKNYIIQFRASGIRVKKTDFFPSLVCTNTQIPIIGWQERYITRKEGLKLQSLEGIKLPTVENAAFRALGNAVNSKIVKLIVEELLKEETQKNKQKAKSELLVSV